MGWLLYGGITNQPLKIEWFILMQTGSYSLTALVAYLLIRRRSTSLKFKLKTSFSMMILKKSVPFALLVLMMTFYYRIDTVMLERMLPDGAEQAGIYAMGYRFFEASNNISFLFAVLLLPIFSRMIKLKEDVSDLVVLAFRILISGALFLGIFSWFFSEEILRLRYVEHIEVAAGPFKILMLCFVAIASNYIFGTLLTANGNMKALNIIAFSGMILNIVLNLILIPKYMVLGSALASLITQIFTSVIQFVISVIQFKFKPNWRLIIQFSLYILFLFSFTQLIYNADWSLPYRFAATFGLFVFLVGITGIISPKSFYILLKSSRD